MADVILRLQFPDGRVLLCPKSTLVNAGGYFSSRFRGDIAPGGDLTDSVGNSLYYVPRDGELFQRYVLPFLFDNKVFLPEFSQDPVLWRKLRNEADFFCLGRLQDLLKVTHSVTPNPEGQGVLYWLGTGKGTHAYKNPFDINQVYVGGWVDRANMQPDEDDDYDWQNEEIFHAATSSCRRALVQYRPAVKGPDNTDGDTSLLEGRDQCHLLGCDAALRQDPVLVDLKSVKLRLTAYSVRYDCCGMKMWKFEGSKDGETWNTLHAALGDNQVKYPSQEKMRMLSGKVQSEMTSDAELLEKLKMYAERNHRGYWEVNSSEFYRFFRFIGYGSDDYDDIDCWCMHGTGLELYGDVQED